MKKLLNMKEATEFLSVSKQTLQRWDREGELKAIRTKGGHRRYDIDELKKFMGSGEMPYSNCTDYSYSTFYNVLCEAQWQADNLYQRGMVDKKTCDQLLKIREDIGKKYLNEFFDNKKMNSSIIEQAETPETEENP